VTLCLETEQVHLCPKVGAADLMIHCPSVLWLYSCKDLLGPIIVSLFTFLKYSILKALVKSSTGWNTCSPWLVLFLFRTGSPQSTHCVRKENVGVCNVCERLASGFSLGILLHKSFRHFIWTKYPSTAVNASWPRRLFCFKGLGNHLWSLLDHYMNN
jgi:hypothetical protein